jgi:Tol biopolymer transport system component
MSPKKNSLLVLLLLAGVSLLFSDLIQQETARELFERAVYLEETKGELESAIKVYERIVNEFPDERATAAKALLRLGGCHEKLGRKEAGKVYRRLVNEYPDQVQEAETARRRLEGLTKLAAAEKPYFRKIHIPTEMPPSGRLSPDGQSLAFVSDGSLWVMPVRGKSNPDIPGAPLRLTERIGAWDASNVSISWSIDGKRIGFLRPVRKGEMVVKQELYLIPAKGGQPQHTQISWKDWAGDVDTLRYALSAGAETVYFAAGSKAEELRIYSMPAQGGGSQALTESTTREPALSPDGSRIVYVKSRPSKQVSATHQVWVRPIEGGEPVLICEVPDPKWARSPVWSPDGRMVAFLASEKGNNHKQVWIVPLDDESKPIAPPSKFDLPGMTAYSLSGWTQDDEIGILIPKPLIQVLYAVPAEGGKAMQLTARETAMPRWSPDGKRIYFAGEAEDWGMGLNYVLAEGGKVNRIPSTGVLLAVYPSQIAISPDGKTLCFSSRTRANPGPYLLTVPTEGGPAAPLTTCMTKDVSPPDFVPEWSPDGTHIAFIRYEEVKPGYKGFNIFTVPRDGGEGQRISDAEDQVQYGSLAWSPDGEVIAFFGLDSTLRLIPAEGGRSRILVSEVSSKLPQYGLAWSPDGKRIAYSARGDLWIVSREGGEPERIGTGLDAAITKMDWSPDGRSIAFTASKGGEIELWLMEDFLHLVKGRK